MEYTILLTRTYLTSFTIDAESSVDALEKFKAMGDER